MKKLIIEDGLENLAKFVKESSEHYDQRLKWHDEKIIDNEVDHIKIAIEHIMVMLLVAMQKAMSSTVKHIAHLHLLQFIELRLQ